MLGWSAPVPIEIEIDKKFNIYVICRNVDIFILSSFSRIALYHEQNIMVRISSAVRVLRNSIRFYWEKCQLSCDSGRRAEIFIFGFRKIVNQPEPITLLTRRLGHLTVILFDWLKDELAGRTHTHTRA